MIEKKYLVSLIAVFAAMIVCVGSVSMVDASDAKRVSDDSGACGNGLSYIFTADDGMMTITGEGDMFSYEKNGKMPWDKYRGHITEVVISEGVTSVSERAFSECKELVSVSIPSTVTSIAKEAFKGCHKLTGISVSCDDIVIGERAFEGCHEAADIVIYGESVTIEKEAFKGCHNVTGIEISCGDAVIGEKAFEGCKGTAGVEISGESVTIEREAFKGCHDAMSIEISCDTTDIGEKAFEGCKEMTDIDFSGSLETTIGKEAFKGCHKLTNVDLCSVTDIGERAFEGCKDIKTLIIPGSVTEISKHAFKGTYDRIVVYNWSGIDLKGYREYYGLSKHAIIIDCSACTVTFDANGGELVGGETAQIAYGAVFEFEQKATPKEAFLGWNTEKDGSGNWIVSGSIWKYTVDKTLYAQWNGEPAKQVTVTFDGNGGSVYKTNTATAVVGKDFFFSQAAKMTGHEFLGWNTQQNGKGITVKTGDTWTIESDTTLYAQWTKAKYNLDFEDGGCEWVKSKPTGYTYGATVSLPDSDYVSKEGFAFMGWYLEEDLSGKRVYSIENTDYGDKTFYAKWAKSCTVTFDAGEHGTLDGEATAKAVEGEVFEFDQKAEAEFGFVFKGWHTSEGTLIQSGNVWTFDTDMTLYAHYDQMK